MKTANAAIRVQRGAALMVGLMLLLVLTLLGVAAMRGTTGGERMSANHQQNIQTFQATEAAIHFVMSELRGELAPPDGVTESILITAINNGVEPATDKLATTERAAAAGKGLTSKAQTAFTGTANLAGFRMGVESGAYVAYQFTIDANGRQAGSHATSHQQQGISRVGPRP
ncbi:MAG: PilX N-terminal domain-containing pilus assembly protein [Stenotrophobium sp.]